MINIVSVLTKFYSIDRLSEIVNMESGLLIKFRNNEIPFYITSGENGRSIPSRVVLETRILERYVNHINKEKIRLTKISHPRIKCVKGIYTVLEAF